MNISFATLLKNKIHFIPVVVYSNATKLTLLATTLGVATLSHGQHEAHVHGLASLTIAIGDEQTEIEFESPAANLLGFEHQARSEEDQATIEKASSLLNAGDKLFEFSGANCSLQTNELNLAGVLADEDHVQHSHENHKSHDDDKRDSHRHTEHTSHDHDSHEHEHEHEDSAHEEHEAVHDHHGTHDETHNENHSEIGASYSFHCDKPEKLQSVVVKLIDYFPAIETINVMWLTDDKQGSEKISSKNNSITFR